MTDDIKKPTPRKTGAAAPQKPQAKPEKKAAAPAVPEKEKALKKELPPKKAVQPEPVEAEAVRRPPKPAQPPKKKPEPEPEPAPEPVEIEKEEPAPGGCLGKLVLIFLILVLLAVLGAGVGYLEIRSRLLPVFNEPHKVEVDIPKGASVVEIGRILEEHKVIRSAEAFRYWVTYKKIGPKLKAGEMILDASLGTPEIVDALVKGSFKLYALTIPEGLTMKEIAQLTEKAGFAEYGEFLSLCRDPEFIKELGLAGATSLEGYLFPETYHFSKNATARDVIAAMVKRFWLVWDRYKTTAKSLSLNRDQVLTLASIVEKETGAADERPLIAAVFLNRLEKGMRLETDPTVIYGIENFNGNLTKADLQNPHPYNTYVHEGLPPGPIANPGEAAIRAVLRPAVTEYLFFVSKNDGTHQFSKTLKEHNKAVAEFQKGGQ